MIRQLGGEIVVFYAADLELVESWRHRAAEIPRDLPVLADPEAGVYRRLELRRSGSYLQLARGGLGPVIASAREGRIPRPTRADMLQLGGDAAVGPDGEIAQLHRAGSPDDRIALRDLVDALA